MSFYTPSPLIRWTKNSTTMEITQGAQSFPSEQANETQKRVGFFWLGGGQVFPSVRELSFCPLKLWCSFMAHFFTPPNEEKERRRLCETLAINVFYFLEPETRGPLIKSACGPGLPDSHRGVWQSHYGVCSFTDTAETVFHWEDSSY